MKWEEIKLVHAMSRFHVVLMYYTAAAVLLKDFLFGVLSALVIYAVLHRFFDKPDETANEDADQSPPQPLAKEGVV